MSLFSFGGVICWSRCLKHGTHLWMSREAAEALAIIVCNAMLSSGLPISTTDTSTWSAVLLYLCELTFGIALTVGSIKGAQSLTNKALGYDYSPNISL